MEIKRENMDLKQKSEMEFFCVSYLQGFVSASCTEAAQPYDPLPPPQTASHRSLSYSHLLPASSESDTAVSAALGRRDGRGAELLNSSDELMWRFSACQRSDSRRAARPDANSKTRGQDRCLNQSVSQQRCMQLNLRNQRPQALEDSPKYTWTLRNVWISSH